MPNTDEIKEMLSDLGRATLRGVRKCPKCGTYNGTRGLVCKNKACDVVFKEAGEKRKLTTDACRLHTGPFTQVFSVRVRDKGPDYRGFVQLLTESADPVESDEGALITQTAALCFVDTCQRSFDASVLKCHEKSSAPQLSLPVTCQHIQAALRCYTEAQPLTIKNSVLNQIACDEDTRQAIWSLIGETTGPLVQRVSKTIMAVKCKASPKHPLGYLHFAFSTSRLKERTEHKYVCNCPEFKSQIKDEGNFLKRCIHFYACICAFASDPKLSEEFSYYVNLCQPATTPTREERQLLSILSEALDGTGAPCEVEVVMQDDATLLNRSHLSVGEVHELAEIQMYPEDGDPLQFAPDEMSDVLSKVDSALSQPKTKRKREDSVSQALLTLHTSNSVKVKSVDGSTGNNKKQLSTDQKSSINKSFKRPDPPDENNANVSFIEWLASVTERINQTMHYQFDGNPDPLVFHVPQVFFDCLRERISSSFGGKKKRLPNFTTAFVRKDSVPLGTFTKYTWHIPSILHVKYIFDTPIMPLDIYRSFVENRDGTFDLFLNTRDDKFDTLAMNDKRPPIKPLEVRTYLKVGNTSPDQIEPTPFTIEWIPDVLPLSQLGELRIHFQFGHQRSGPGEKMKDPFIRQSSRTSMKSKAAQSARKRQKLAPLHPQDSQGMSVFVNPDDVLLL